MNNLNKESNSTKKKSNRRQSLNDPSITLYEALAETYNWNPKEFTGDGNSLTHSLYIFCVYTYLSIYLSIYLLCVYV